MAKYYKGDTVALYCKFAQNNVVVKVEKPQIRILHEFDDNVYEDLSWTDMTAFEDGYVYNFDTNICDNYGKYVIVYKGVYDGKTLNIIDNFDLIVKNVEDTNSVEIYGYVNDINNNNLLKDVTVKVVNLDNNNIVYQTTTDIDGKWWVYIFPGNYDFIFEMDNFEPRSVRAQIGDENKETQFNTIGLEKIADKSLGTGLFKIQDDFTSKNNMGISNIKISIYSVNDTDNIVVSTVTDDKGKWKAFLDSGNYLMKIVMSSGVEKMFNLNVYNDGSKTMEEIKVKDTQVVSEVVNNGNGSEKVTDFVLDAHGNGISNVSIKAYGYNSVTDKYEYVCEDTTSTEGQFELNLNKGKYKFVVSGEGFKTNEQIINI